MPSVTTLAEDNQIQLGWSIPIRLTLLAWSDSLTPQPQHWQLITSLEALYLTGPADDGVQKTLKDFGRGQELELDRDTKAGIAQ